MANFLIGLVALAVVVTVVTVIGHGLWMTAAAISRLVFGTGENGQPGTSHCARCGHPTGLKNGTCVYCGFETVAAQRRGLKSAIRQIQQMRDQDRLEPTICDHAIQALSAAEQQLRSPQDPSEARRQRSVLSALHDAVTTPPSQPAVPASPAASPQTPAAWQELADAATEPIEAELVADDDAVQVVRPAAAATMPATVPDFARDTEAAPTAFSPRRTLADMLQSFMEDKNIRWGELASGMLIVGSAIGLVISLRATLAEISERIRYFPALLFLLGTVAIHAAGLYTLRRWKLRSTSRGVLIIATLLVPLSFAAGILLSGSDAERSPVTSPLYISAVAAGLLGYGAITSLSARSLCAEGWWRLVVAVMGTSAGQLIINRLAEAESTRSSVVTATALFALPLASFLVATLAQLQLVARKTHLTRARSAQTFTVLGIAAFALVVPLGLLLYRCGAIRETLAVLSPSLSLAASVVMGIGIAVHWRCESRQSAETRTAGTTLAVLGSLLMAGAMILAWPSPDVLIAVSVVTAIAFVVLAHVGQVAALHAGAAVAATLAYLLIFLRVSVPLAGPPNSADLVEALLMGRSALALSLAAVVLVAVGDWFRRKSQVLVAWTYLGSAAGIAAVSTVISLYAGFWTGEDVNWTTLLFAMYSVAGLIASVRWQHPRITWIASAITLVTLVHLLGWNRWFAGQLANRELTLANPVLLAFITHGVLVVMAALAIGWQRHFTGESKANAPSEDPLHRGLLEPLAVSGVLSTAVTVPCVVVVSTQTLGIHAAYAAGIAVTWAIAGLIVRMPSLIGAGHVAATVAIGFAVAALAAQQPWPDPALRDLRHVQWQVIVLGLWCALGAATCRVSRSRISPQLLRGILPPIDTVLNVLIVVLLGLGVIGCTPGVMVELGFIAPDLPIAQDPWHMAAYQDGSWLALASIALALVLALAEGVTESRIIGVVVATAVVPLLVSGGWETGRAVASAGRWTFAIYTLCWAALVAARGHIVVWGHRLLGIDCDAAIARRNAPRNLAMVVGVFPVLGLTLLAVGQSVQGTAWGGPLAGTWFAQLSPTVSYAVPLAILAAAMLALAVREGSAVFAMLGSMITECLIALCVDMSTPVAESGRTSDWMIAMVQWTAFGLGGYGLVWLGLSRWIDRDTPDSLRWLRTLQVVIPGAAVAWLSAWTLGVIFFDPAAGVADLGRLGHWLTYVAAGIAALGVAWHVWRDTTQLQAMAVGLPAALAPIVAATAGGYAGAPPWLGYHVLTGVLLAIALAGAGLIVWRSAILDDPRWLVPIRIETVVLGLAVSVLMVRGCLDDPSRPDWTVGICGALCVLWTVLGLSGRSQWSAYASVASVLFGTWSLWWELAQRRGFDFVVGGAYVIVVAGALAALFWLLVEVWYQTKCDESFDPQPGQVRVHSCLALALSALMGLFVLGGATFSVVARLGPSASSLTVTDAWGTAALLGLGVLLFAMLWDRRSRATLLALYVWGLMAIAMGLNFLERTTDQGAELTVMAACLAGAGYIALTGHLWKWGVNLAQWAARLQIPDPVARLENTSRWLPPLNVVGALFICFLGFVTMFVTGDRALRMGTAFAPAMLAYGMGCLAQQQRRFAMQCFALLILSLAAVYIGWADVRVPAGQIAVLAYAARLLICVAGMTLLYAVVVARWMGPQSGWYDAVRRTSLILAVATIGTLSIVLALEATYFTPGVGAPIAAPEVIAISVMLCGFVMALLSMALLPGKDPLDLTETGRTAYVYAAQLMAALLFAHVYLAEPQLFHGRLREYWPYIVMLLAFGSVAFGEFCLRRNWRVIAEPMVRTGGFLPLLPALAAWAFSETRYPLVLFCAGLVYVFLAMTRRSFYAGVAAAVMGNGALWALLSDQGLELLAQPQFWLIPPAFSVLVAAHINRARLDDSALTAIRYICVMIIYLSSAGEMFMKLVVSDAPEDWLRPIILASLAVAGIFAGILLRVRAFLYLGASFLLLSIVAMVWNAGRLVQHTWPWWVFGISLGLAILVVFGVFEKHRREVQALIARLRQWDA